MLSKTTWGEREKKRPALPGRFFSAPHTPFFFLRAERVGAETSTAVAQVTGLFGYLERGYRDGPVLFRNVEDKEHVTGFLAAESAGLGHDDQQVAASRASSDSSELGSRIQPAIAREGAAERLPRAALGAREPRHGALPARQQRIQRGIGVCFVLLAPVRMAP